MVPCYSTPNTATYMVPCYSTPNTATYDALALCTPLDASSSPFFSFFFLEHPKHGLKFFLGVSFSLQVYSLYTNNVLRRFNHGWSSLVVRRSLQLRRRRKGCHQRFRMECVLVFLLRLLPKGVRPPRPPAVFPENRIMRAFVPKARARARFCHRDASKKRCGLKKDVESSSSFLRSRLFSPHSWIHPSIRKPWREEYSFSVQVF